MKQEESQQHKNPGYYQYQEDEVELIDYLRVIWKWKWLIVGGALICAIIAAVINLQMPRVYEISTIIKPGIAGIDDKGKLIYVDSETNIKETLNQGIYNKRIEEALQMDSLKTGINFKATVFGKTKIVKITSQWEKEDIALGMKAVNHLLRFLSDDEQYNEQKKADYDMRIYIKQDEIKQLEKRRQFLRESLKYSKHRVEMLKKETGSIKINTEVLIKKRDSLLKESKAEIEILLIFYSTIIQQNRTYLNQVSDQIYNFIEKEKDYLREIEGIIGDINIVESQMASLNKIKEMSSGIMIIKAPEISRHPVKPKKKQVILLAGVVGLFMFFFLAFFIEYIKKTSKHNGKVV